MRKLLLPTLENKLLAKWQGPYQVKWKMGPVAYEVCIPTGRQPLQTFHVNLLKKWHARPPLPTPAAQATPQQTLYVRAIEEEEEVMEKYFPSAQQGSELNLKHLTEEQRGQLLSCSAFPISSS